MSGCIGNGRLTLTARSCFCDPVTVHLYPDANHGFDAPGEKIRTLPQFTTVDGVIPVVGPDPAAREDARKRLPAFLKVYLLPEKAG